MITISPSITSLLDKLSYFPGESFPLFDISSSRNEVVVTYEVPGYSKFELDVKYDPLQGYLILTGAKGDKGIPTGTYLAKNIPDRSDFSSKVYVGRDFQVKNATYLDGELRVVLGLPEVTASSIPIS